MRVWICTEHGETDEPLYLCYPGGADVYCPRDGCRLHVRLSAETAKKPSMWNAYRPRKTGKRAQREG